MMATFSDSDTLANRQVMLSLAYLSYCGDQITTSNPDAEIAGLIAAGIQQIPVLCTSGSNPVPSWTVVWGPVSYTPAGALYQDSLMFVAQNQSTGQYGIAIRGTNHVSDLDWLMDDFDVLQQMPWPPGSAVSSATGMISESTSIALQVLLGMSDGTQTLLQYLHGVTGWGIDLWVTGHSLGGCLASALGLYLKENASSWDQSGASTVSCVTFAAPTAGNADFATLIDNAFQNTMFDRVQCSFDIVPLAWAAENIVNSAQTSSNIFDIYDLQEGSKEAPPGIDFSEMSFLDSAVWTAEVLGSVLPAVQSYFQPLGYTQPQASTPLLQGTFNTNYSVYDKDFTTTFEAFASQASYQHSDSYPTLLQVEQLLDPNVINVTGSGGGVGAPPASPRAQFARGLVIAAFQAMKAAQLRPPPVAGARSV